MPELPEVETVARQLRKRLLGATVVDVELIRPDYIRLGREFIERDLPGRRIRRIDRVGKRIICTLAPDGQIAFHLGMSGRLTVEPVTADVIPHTHVRLRFADRNDELRIRDPRRFGGVWMTAVGRIEPAPRLAALGPDALAISTRLLRSILDRRRQIKALLMDQTTISGLGNIYCDEALFRARIHPLTSASELTAAQIRRLAGAIRATLQAALRHGGSTFREYRSADGRPGAFQNYHLVYGRTGKPCRRCRRPIVRIAAAGRSTHLCTRCQPR